MASCVSAVLAQYASRYDGGSIISLEPSLARSRTALCASTSWAISFYYYLIVSFDLEVSPKLGGVENPDELRGLA